MERIVNENAEFLKNSAFKKVRVIG